MIIDIRVYWNINPIISTSGVDLLFQDMPLTFSFGILDDTLGIYQITDVEYPNFYFKVLEPENYLLNTLDVTAITIEVSSDESFSVNNQNKTLRFECRYQGFYKNFSFILGQQFPTINQDYLINMCYAWLPPKVYTQSTESITYQEINGYASVFNALYNNKNQIGTINYYLSSLFPDSGNYQWEQSLNKTVKLLDKDGVNYPKLLWFINQSKKHNSPNPYFIAFNITKFIKLWANKQRYVYINEGFISYFNGFIIGNNNIGNCVFLDNIDPALNPPKIYILTDNPDNTLPLTTIEQNYIDIWVRELIPAHITYQINYTKSSTDLSLTPIGNTWQGDPRAGNLATGTDTYCLAYNEGVLEEALGMVLTSSDNYLVNIESIVCTSHPNGSTYNISRNNPNDPIGGVPLAFTLVPPVPSTINIFDYLVVLIEFNTYLTGKATGTVFSQPIKIKRFNTNTYYLYPNLSPRLIEEFATTAKITYYIGNGNSTQYTYNLNIS